MVERKRFSHLEPAAKLPPKVQAAISKLNRFEHLEIGGTKPAFESAPVLGRILCVHCGKANEEQRELCWACFKATRPQGPQGAKPAPGQEIAIMLDGVGYTSSQPDLPEKVRVLMDWIRDEGYSPELLTKWQRWLKEKKSAVQPKSSPKPRAAMRELYQVEAVKGQRGSVLRMDGKLYQSGDPQLPSEIQEIFGYIERDGVTPELMEHLRLFGTMVKFRPHTTPLPSDGDMHFWGEVKKIFKKPAK